MFTLQIKEHTSIILKAETGGRVKKSIKIEGTRRLDSWIDRVVDYHLVCFVSVAGGNVLYHARQTPFTSIAEAGKEVKQNAPIRAECRGLI